MPVPLRQGTLPHEDQVDVALGTEPAHSSRPEQIHPEQVIGVRLLKVVMQSLDDGFHRRMFHVGVREVKGDGTPGRPLMPLT